MTRPRDIADGINRIDTSAADATAITIDANEKVGIGTSSPATYGVDNAEDLVIGQGDGNHGITISSFNTSNGTLAFSDTTNATVGRGFVDYDHNVDAMSFGTLSTERMRITSGGRIGIGESNPDGLVHLTGDTNSNGAELFLQVNNNNTTDNLGAIHFGNNVDSTLSKILSGTSGANNSSYLTFSTSNAGSQAERMRIDSSGNLLVGTTSDYGKLTVVEALSGGQITVGTSTTNSTTKFGGVTGIHYTSAEERVGLVNSESNSSDNIIRVGGGLSEYNAATNIRFYTAANSTTTAGSEAMRIDSDGSLIMGYSTTPSLNTAGVVAYFPGTTNTQFWAVNSRTDGGGAPVHVNRQGSDGVLISFKQAGTQEGYIHSSGTSILYQGFTGNHFARLSDNSKPTILKGTVLETTGEMMDWYRAEFTLGDGDDAKDYSVPCSKPDNTTVGETFSFTVAAPDEENDQCPAGTYTAMLVREGDIKHTKVKVSNTLEAKAVYGVFSNWDAYDDLNNDLAVVSLGTFVIRINSTETVVIGDLLDSNGDGTAKVQSDDIIRARTIGKVISTVKQETYSDGSYTVPCAIYCG